MKIALVSPYDFAYPGGVVNHISCLEHNLTRMGHEVKIIAPASSAVYSFGDRFIRVGKPRSVPVSGSVARVTLSPWLSSRVKEVLEQEKFDVCHLHEPLVPMLCPAVIRLSHIPLVGTFHSSGGKPWYTMMTPVGKLFFKKWFSKLDVKIAVAQPALNYISKNFPGDYQVVPNGIDTEHFCPDVPPIEEYMDGKINILFVGRMEKRKGVDYLLQAYKRVKQEIPESRLILVGPGVRLRNKYMKRVKRARLQDVVFVGYSSYSDLPRYYKTADVVCAPATGCESFGIVLLEAMAVGKPLVASAIEGYNSVMTDGVEGLLVPPKNSEQLAEALITLINDKTICQQMGARGRLTALKYDWGNVAQQLLECYQKALNGSSTQERLPEVETIQV